MSEPQTAPVAQPVAPPQAVLPQNPHNLRPGRAVVLKKHMPTDPNDPLSANFTANTEQYVGATTFILPKEFGAMDKWGRQCCRVGIDEKLAWRLDSLSPVDPGTLAPTVGSIVFVANPELDPGQNSDMIRYKSQYGMVIQVEAGRNEADPTLRLDLDNRQWQWRKHGLVILDRRHMLGGFTMQLTDAPGSPKIVQIDELKKQKGMMRMTATDGRNSVVLEMPTEQFYPFFKLTFDRVKEVRDTKKALEAQEAASKPKPPDAVVNPLGAPVAWT